MSTDASGGPPRPFVFVSHSTVDGWIALQIARRVKQCGAGCFVDKDSIQYGDPIDKALVRNAKAATEFLVLLTPWGLERPYVMLELGLFYAEEKRIIGLVHGLNRQQDVALRFGLSIAGVNLGPAPTGTAPGMTPHAVDNLPAIVRDVRLIELNGIEGYFAQLRSRVGQWEANHGKKPRRQGEG